MQATEDLLWVVNSPSFVEGANTAPAQTLARDDIEQGTLAEFMAQRGGHRVGHYFEHLLLFWLQEIRQVEIVGSGIQLRDGKRTIGEIDFLYRDEDDRLTHCEASVKFFLHHPRSGTSHFPGPNAVDNYERKIAKLFDKQLAASQAYYPDVEQRHGFVKGMVFYRSDVELPKVLPDRMPVGHGRGTWLFASELDALRIRQDVRGCIADKPHWLAPQADAQLFSVELLCGDLDVHFANRAHPVMVSLRSLTTDLEIERMFVVPDGWPDPRPLGAHA